MCPLLHFWRSHPSPEGWSEIKIISHKIKSAGELLLNKVGINFQGCLNSLEPFWWSRESLLPYGNRSVEEKLKQCLQKREKVLQHCTKCSSLYIKNLVMKLVWTDNFAWEASATNHLQHKTKKKKFVEESKLFRYRVWWFFCPLTLLFVGSLQHNEEHFLWPMQFISKIFWL